MKRSLLGLLVAVVAVSVPGAMAAPPPGATAVYRDGTYSFSKHRAGTCSHHGGVAHLLGRRTQTHGCTRSALPDRQCSRGGYYSKLTKAVICRSSFDTGAIRNVPQSEKSAVEREYRMAATYYGRSIEIDHIVPLELGGSNVIANLFPEPGTGKANYHYKDALENRAKSQVCEGRLTLRAARRGLATSWEKLYRRLFGHPPKG